MIMKVPHDISVLRLVLLLSATLAAAFAAPQPGPDAAGAGGLSSAAGRIVIHAEGLTPPTPLYFSAAVDQRVKVSAQEIVGEARVTLRVVQGKADILTLSLSGDGEIVEVVGKGLLEWSVRQAAPEPRLASAKAQPAPIGRRFLDLKIARSEDEEASQQLEVLVRSRLAKPAVPGAAAVLLLGPGDAVGFSSKVAVTADASIDFRVTTARGLTALDGGRIGPEGAQFFSVNEGQLELRLIQRGAALADAELIAAQLHGQLGDSKRSVQFRVTGQLKALKSGARLRLLSGQAALNENTAGDGWHVELDALKEGAFAYELVADREGVIPVDISFSAEVRENGDWQTLSFSMPAGAVVPLRLAGLGTDVKFKPDAAIVPAATARGWEGFLPADGSANVAWKRTREAAEGALFFTGYELAEVRVGAGLLRQSSQIAFRVLQGKLGAVRCKIEGAGEILGVDGTNVVGWKVVGEGATRVLEVRFSRPVETEGEITVRSQAELGAFPVRAEPLRLIPENVVRHSGFLRVANAGAVRLEVTESVGMMQLSPSQYPGPAIEAATRQVFVYRFPSAGYAYRVVASQIQPEVNVSQIATYELGETDRVISASVELDVREAPLREWSLQIPDDYTVVALTGSGVADYAAETAAREGYRAVRVLFSTAIEGRQLLKLRLEKNQSAAAGDWRLRPLRYPGVKAVRGHVGAVATAGYRMVPTRVDLLVEVPLTYFPTPTPGLQQAWRLREADWAVDLRIEALGQSVQADVFHLYTVKEGVVYGSVLLNYFVVGAPTSEWRIEVPAAVGNIDVVGQNVRKDWRREGDQVIVALHQPVLGAATLLITFEQPMSARGGVIKPGEVKPLGVQAERGFIQIASPLQVKHDVRTADGGLLRLEPLELPAEFRLLTTSPSLAVYQYTARPFSLEMNLEWYTAGETVDQIVDFAQLSSQVSREGQIVTEARYFVKTRGRKALRLILPEGVKLWEARVENEVTPARIDGNQTLIPLPARLNPNEPVSVSLRLGQAAGGASRATLLAPRTLAPSVIHEWILRADAGRLLVPKGGNDQLVHPPLTETGFEWISRRAGLSTAVVLALAALSALLFKGQGVSGARLGAAVVVALLSVGGALMLMVTATANRRPNLAEHTYAATMVPAEETVSVHVANVSPWRAMIVPSGVIVAVLGGGILVASVLRNRRASAEAARRGLLAVPVGMDRWLPVLGAMVLAAGWLAQRGGAAVFFGGLAASLFFGVLLRGVLGRSRPASANEDPPAAPVAGAAPIVSLLFAIGLTTFVVGPAAQSLPAETREPVSWQQEGLKPAQSIVQNWVIRADRLFGEVEVTVRGGIGDSFLLLRPPALLTEFKGDGLRISKIERDGQIAYCVAPERTGQFTARAKFEMPFPQSTLAIPLPTGLAASQRVTLLLEQPGWEFTSSAAVRISPTPGLADDRSGATLVLAPTASPVIKLQPKRRDLAAEATQFFVEGTNLYVPGPGVVNGYTRFTVRPVQGRVSELEIDVPAGLTVGDVARGPIGAWRFDPQKRRLHVALEPAQSGPFKFDVETQLGSGALPFDLMVEPLRVVGPAGEVGMIALAFGPDAQPEGIRATGLSAVTTQDFDASVLPRNRNALAAATVQQVWRYGQAPGKVELKIAPVAAEVRVATRHVISLDDDRLVMSADLTVSITRVGLFKLSFALPEGLELEAATGAALSQWTESQEGSQRIVTLHLNGRTMGDQTFALTLAGSAPKAQASWAVPRVSLREGTRQTGEVMIVPGKGLRLRAAERENVTQLDPRAMGGLQPGTLAFRLLQENWTLRVGIEALDAWVTVQSLQEVTLREGQTLTRIGLRYRVENAVVKQLRVRLLGLSEERVRTVRAAGSAVSDMVKVGGETDVWEIRFQRGIAGETDVQIEFQGPAARDQNEEAIAPLVFVGARQAVQFVTVRSGGRLELAADVLPRGWNRVDWSAVPAALQDRADRSVPALCFRVAEPEGPLAVAVRRHDVAEALKLRVTQSDLTTLFSPAGTFMTAVELKMDVVEKSTLRVRLPQGARLYNTLVNGEAVSVVREGTDFLFHVAPSTQGERSAAVRLVYAASAAKGGDLTLTGPSLNVPLENVSWRVVLPAGYDLDDYSGGLRLREDRAAGRFGVEQYERLVSSRRSAEAKKAAAMLQEANTLLQQGDQQKAGEVLSRATNVQALDDASNEDARVQLRNLKTQQTVISLNTRRQRMYFNNRLDSARNEQLEQAASLNPYMQGKVNFDPQQLDQLLMGNTLEENTALRGIAARLVDQQLAAEPAPGAIDVTLPERGRVLTFTRSLQVDGAAPLELKLEIGPMHRTGYVFSALVLIALGAVTLMTLAPARRA